MKKNNRFVTGTRPTGRLHIGHYAGAVRNWVEMQNSGEYDPFVFIADMQALTDNADNPEKIKQGFLDLIETILEYLLSSYSIIF